MELCCTRPLRLASLTEHEFSKFVRDAARVCTLFLSMLSNASCVCVSARHFKWTLFGLSAAAATRYG